MIFALMTLESSLGSNSFFGVSFCHVARLARLLGGMPTETEDLSHSKLHQLPSGKWYVHCKHCATDIELEARNEDEAFAMLEGWRLSMPGREKTAAIGRAPHASTSIGKSGISGDRIQLDRRRRRQLHQRTSLPTHPTQQHLRSML